jgi:formamidopyrimidine-DNA glycosylase
MPELPEVETTRLGVSPHVLGCRIKQMVVRDRRLRWPVSDGVEEKVADRRVDAIHRRGKYLLFSIGEGVMLLHLGMSGSLRMTTEDAPIRKHDHVDLVMEDGQIMRFHDPRRFGCLLWLEGDPHQHALLMALGPEPLGADFSGDYLYQRSRGRKAPIKAFIMDSHVVVGVGNIYANEALFAAGIHPASRAGSISKARYELLAQEIINILSRAIAVGGTTLRDFVGGDGKPGYFQQTLMVYGRADQPCHQCGSLLRETRQGQRATVFCSQCQRR